MSAICPKCQKTNEPIIPSVIEEVEQVIEKEVTFIKTDVSEMDDMVESMVKDAEPVPETDSSEKDQTEEEIDTEEE